jgi:L-iditol 2-dehydrogenase
VDHRLIGTHWPGGFAQYVHLPGEVLERGMVHKMPKGLSFEGASLSEPVSSVLISQSRAGVELGSSILVIGDGPIGCLHVEVARSRGARPIIMAGLTRLRFADKFDPDLLIDAGKGDTVAEVLKHTEGLGVDVAIIANPVADTQQQGVEAVKKRGRIVLFGGISKSNPMTTLNSNLIHYNELVVMGAFSYPAYVHQQALELIRDGKIDAAKYFTNRVSLEGLVEGIKAAERGEALKVLVNPWA